MVIVLIVLVNERSIGSLSISDTSNTIISFWYF